MRVLNSTLKLLLLVVSVVAVPVAPAADLTELIVVVQNEGGEPIPRASVIVGQIKSKPGATKIKVRKSRLQLRTSMQGTAPLPPIPQGRYMIQVISAGYQTYGSADLVLDQPEQTLTITLEPPHEQISVHKKP